MADGGLREAYRNTYTITTVDAGGAVVITQETRIEFLLDTNANAVRGRRYRRTSAKQAATFAE